MADQKLAPIHDFSFLDKQIFLLYLSHVSWYILTIFHQKHGSSPLFFYIFKKIYRKMKSLKTLKCSPPVKNTQNFGV